MRIFVRLSVAGQNEGHNRGLPTVTIRTTKTTTTDELEIPLRTELTRRGWD